MASCAVSALYHSMRGSDTLWRLITWEKAGSPFTSLPPGHISFQTRGHPSGAESWGVRKAFLAFFLFLTPWVSNDYEYKWYLQLTHPTRDLRKKSSRCGDSFCCLPSAVTPTGRVMHENAQTLRVLSGAQSGPVLTVHSTVRLYKASSHKQYTDEQYRSLLLFCSTRLSALLHSLQTDY